MSIPYPFNRILRKLYGARYLTVTTQLVCFSLSSQVYRVNRPDPSRQKRPPSSFGYFYAKFISKQLLMSPILVKKLYFSRFFFRVLDNNDFSKKMFLISHLPIVFGYFLLKFNLLQEWSILRVSSRLPFVQFVWKCYQLQTGAWAHLGPPENRGDRAWYKEYKGRPAKHYWNIVAL